MNKTTAYNIASKFKIPLCSDFHALSADVVCRILKAAVYWGYRNNGSENGSRARYFYAYLSRAAAGPKWGTEYVIQGNYGFGYEDECFEETRKEARARLHEYCENGPGSYRLVSRRVKLRD